jgi:leucyl/phenylalanyl-tRNA--protein transferase
MPVYLLGKEPGFPPAGEADADGLIAIGGDFSVLRLLNAYASGIFPWFVEEDEIFWFSPDPRMVLYPGRLKLTRSLQRAIRSGGFTVTADCAFAEVIEACSKVPRPGQEGTWITGAFVEGYTALHKAGFAHSVEVYRNGTLAGGLYGLSLGNAFFGESMFHHERDASKVALAVLNDLCMEMQFSVIDCQVPTAHLLSMGAEEISRQKYLTLLEEALKHPTRRGKWVVKDKVKS